MTFGPALSRRASLLIFLGLWLATCAVLIALTWPFIVPLNFRDPDDALRLVQVRDLLAGQSWFDLTQHRIFPPHGVPMHWSRLVDLPIALLLLLIELMLGPALATRVVLVTVPLLLLLALAAILYRIMRVLSASRALALLAVALLLSALSVLIQFAPLRIDHHGAQVVAGAMAVWALVRTGRDDGRRGLVTGVAMACWLQISFEGLPYAVAAGAVFGLHHVLRKDRWADLQDYLLALPLTSAALLVAMHYPQDAAIPWCDSFSPAYLWPLALVSLLVLVGHQIVPGRSALRRALPLAIAGAAGVAALVLASPQCLAGPFKTLDPLVYNLWYLGVREGLPIGVQKLDLQAIIVAPAVLGLIGSVLALRRAQPSEREAWINLLILQVAAFLVALTVMRAMTFAHVLALPGNAVLIAVLVGAAQQLRLSTARVLASAACALATPLGASAITAALFMPDDAPGATTAGDGDQPDRSRCFTYATLRGLDALPPALIFTPLDIGSHLLAYTHHSVLGTGHHRNGAGMHAVLAGFTAPSDKAHAIVLATGADYLALCPGENEVERYRRLYPRSLIADLLAHRPPSWLERVPMRPGESIVVYRIVRSAR